MSITVFDAALMQIYGRQISCQTVKRNDGESQKITHLGVGAGLVDTHT